MQEMYFKKRMKQCFNGFFEVITVTSVIENVMAFIFWPGLKFYSSF